MALTLLQIKEIAQNPLNVQTVQRARKYQNKLRFHVETHMERNCVSTIASEFFQWVGNLIPPDKLHTFKHLFTFPLPTNELTAEIFSALEKVYDARDAYEEYNFVSPAYMDDWNSYRAEVLKASDFWRNTAFEKMKSSINGVLIVDLPAMQTASRPDPYFYFLEIEHVADFSLLANGRFEWIKFRQAGNKMAVYCDGFYRMFDVNDNGEMADKPFIEVAHDLGYCPADFFWQVPLETNTPALKKSPISNQMAAFDWLLFFETSKKHLDLYAPYPIYSGYEQSCEYENTDNGNYCDNGLLRNAAGGYVASALELTTKCPVCGDKRLAGVGSFVEIPIPSKDNDQADMRNPVQITTVDAGSLDYNVKECDRLRLKIYTSTVGVGGDVKLNEAFNLEQVQASFEGRKNVLISIKKNFEHAQKFVDDTICRLRYGAYYIGSTISLGTEYYVYGVDELQTQYKTAKEAGATDYELDVIQDQIIETENKNNPMQLARANTLKHLEPYRHQTRTEVVTLWEKGLANEDNVIVKLNFSNFVARFERENTDIVNFGKAVTFREKVEQIKKRFLNYVNDEKTNRKQPAAPGTGAGAN